MSAAQPDQSFSFRNWYWWFQSGGWALYILLNGIILYLGDALSTSIIYWLLIAWLTCTGLTEILRSVIIKNDWLKLSNAQAIPRIALMVVLMSAAMATLSWAYELFASGNSEVVFNLSRWLRTAASFGLAFTIWSSMYYLIITVENYRKAEIENLRWEALRTETELNRLKSQLNPHFMFNAMNVIRALVDESPAKSKEAITQLSSLLRSTLQAGKHKLIPLGQELEVVRAYLHLESARMEERLRITWAVDPGCESIEFPPLMLQTLTENCIKHGISKLPEGGDLKITIRNPETDLIIELENSGYYDSSAKPESGFGIKNTLERLELLYGKHAEFNISNSDHKTVITRLNIRKNANT